MKTSKFLRSNNENGSIYTTTSRNLNKLLVKWGRILSQAVSHKQAKPINDTVGQNTNHIYIVYTNTVVIYNK